MTDRDPTEPDRDCGGDVAAYALGALEPAEADAFRSHLETCVVCRDELTAFQQVVDVLPMSVPAQRAPRSLRRRVLRAVENEPRLAPSSERRVGRPGSRLGRLFVPRSGLAFGTALAIAAVAFVGVELASSSSSGSRVISAQVTGPGTAQLQLSGSHGELVVHHFSPPPAGQIYEVWLKRANRAPAPTSALFSVTAKGDGDIDVPGNLHGVAQVMVTPEPAGGSRVPTHPAVILANLN
jgi:anti-sigma factor RsiW